MEKDIDLNMIIELVNQMAARLRENADEIERLAIKIQNTKDITYTSEVMSSISNGIFNLRLDLLVTRPIRALMRR